MELKSLEELVRTRNALPLIRALANEGQGRIELLDADPQSAASTLLALQVSTRTPLGSVAYYTGGILVDSGWLRILGSGHPRLLWGLAEWNGLQVAVPKKRILAHDVLGGFFALESNRRVSYFSPDSLRWENTDLTHTDWLTWALGPDLGDFYEHFRWTGWQKEIHSLECSQGLLVEPFLFRKGPALVKRKRKPMPIRELWSLYQDLAQKGGLDP